MGQYTIPCRCCGTPNEPRTCHPSICLANTAWRYMKATFNGPSTNGSCANCGNYLGDYRLENNGLLAPCQWNFAIPNHCPLFGGTSQMISLVYNSASVQDIYIFSNPGGFTFAQWEIFIPGGVPFDCGATKTFTSLVTNPGVRCTMTGSSWTAQKA